MNDIELLRVVRHLTNEESDAECRATAAWIASDPARAREVALLHAAWARGGDEAAGPSVSDLDAERAWAALVRRRMLRAAPAPAVFPAKTLAATRPEEGSHRVERRNPATTRAWLRGIRVTGMAPQPRRPGTRVAGRAAAVVALVAGGLFAARSVVHRTPASASRLAAGPLREVVTARGQRAELVLADGSRVVLGAASRLRYDTAAFGRTTREVQLDGEAMFEVRHDAARPFVVRTARTVVRDLGTRFLLRDYRADADAPTGVTAEVVVADGRVALTPSRGRSRAPSRGDPTGDAAAGTSQSVVIQPGERGRVLPGGALVRERGVDVDAAFAWTRGGLVFRATPLAEAAAQFGRWYDVIVLVPDARLARRPLTATFAGEGAAEALRLAAAAAGARVEHRPGGRLYVLRPQ